MSIYYEGDGITLHHASCLEETRWLAEGDVLVTDPPYGRAWRQGRLKRKGGRGYETESVARAGIVGDESTEVRDRVLEAWGEERMAVVFGDLMLPPPSGTRLVGIYAKPGDAGMRGAIGGMRRDAEAIYLLGSRWGAGLGGRSSIFRTTVPTVGAASGLVAQSGGHPHAKPLDVLRALISLTPGGTVADPFAGSGSTLVAARFLGRTAVGVEIEERFCEMAARRLSQGLLDFDALGGDERRPA